MIAGPVSGGLTCRDYDRAGTAAISAGLGGPTPKLAGVLPTAQTGRGFHVYFRSKADHVLKLDDGEVYAATACACCPQESASVRRASYHRWTVSLPAESLPFLDPRTVGLLLCTTQRTQRTQRNQRTQRKQNNLMSPLCCTCDLSRNDRPGGISRPCNPALWHGAASLRTVHPGPTPQGPATPGRRQPGRLEAARAPMAPASAPGDRHQTLRGKAGSTSRRAGSA